jgi:hypothetical protein
VTYDVVTLTASDQERVLASRVSLERAHAVAREHCGLPEDAVGVVEDECTIYHGQGEVFATVTPRAPRP